MLFEIDGKRPQIHPTAQVSPTAVLRGDVRIGAGSVVLDGAVLTTTGGSLQVGDNCVIMEHAVLRGSTAQPCHIGNAVLIGPHAHVSGCHIEDDVFVATHASVFNGARLGRGSEVRIGGVVHINSHLEAGGMVPIGWIAVGDPARSYAPADHDTLWPIQKSMRFSETVWGEKRPQGEQIRRYAQALAKRMADETRIAGPEEN